MKEAIAKHIQDPTFTAIWEALVRIEVNINCLISEQKPLQRSYEELRESLEFTLTKQDGGHGKEQLRFARTNEGDGEDQHSLITKENDSIGNCFREKERRKC